MKTSNTFSFSYFSCLQKVMLMFPQPRVPFKFCITVSCREFVFQFSCKLFGLLYIKRTGQHIANLRTTKLARQFRNPLVVFSSRSSSGSSNVPSSVSTSNQYRGRRDSRDYTCHSGWSCDTLCTTRLRDKKWHSYCHSCHYPDLGLRTFDHCDLQENHRQFLRN